MNLENKSFRNIRNNEVVTVKQNFRDVCIMSDGTKMNAQTLLDSNSYVEVGGVNESLNKPESFDSPTDIPVMGSYHDSLLSSLREVDVNNINNDSQATVSRRIIDPVMDNSNSNIAVNPGNDMFVTGESEREYLMKKYNVSEEANKDVLVNESTRSRDVDVISQQSKNELNPIKVMFKGAKRITDVDFSIVFSDKIPRIDFIEMMEDTYDTSIIDFLVEDIFDKVMSDPSIFKNSIREKIEERVYGKKTSAKVAPKKATPNKTTPKKTQLTSKDTDGATSEKKPSTRGRKKVVTNEG